MRRRLVHERLCVGYVDGAVVVVVEGLLWLLTLMGLRESEGFGGDARSAFDGNAPWQPAPPLLLPSLLSPTPFEHLSFNQHGTATHLTATSTATATATAVGSRRQELAPECWEARPLRRRRWPARTTLKTMCRRTSQPSWATAPDCHPIYIIRQKIQVRRRQHHQRYSPVPDTTAFTTTTTTTSSHPPRTILRLYTDYTIFNGEDPIVTKTQVCRVGRTHRLCVSWAS